MRKSGVAISGTHSRSAWRSNLKCFQNWVLADFTIKESRLFTTLITPSTRLFQQTMFWDILSARAFPKTNVLHPWRLGEGVLGQMANLLVYGETQALCDSRLFKLLRTLKQAGVTLKKGEVWNLQRLCKVPQTDNKFWRSRSRFRQVKSGHWHGGTKRCE